MAMVLQQTIHGFDIVKITNIEEVKELAMK